MNADVAARKPLTGVKVIDLSHYGAGPIGSMVLGDLGADVIKVEHPQGDSLRRAGVTFPQGWSTFFLAVNRNKRFVGIDFKTERGQELIRDLVRDADVVLENARPGSWDKYGLDYDSLAAINDRLIYASISGFGDRGPMRDWLAMDLIAQAAGGIMGITGTEQTGPARVGAAIIDATAGRLAAFGVVTALFDRVTSGKGQKLDVSLFGTAVSMLPMREVEYQFSGEIPPLTGTAHGQIIPAQAFETADGRRVLLYCFVDAHFNRWAAAAGCPELAEDPRFRTNVARKENSVELLEIVQGIMRERTEEEWTRALAGVVPYGPVLEFDQLWEHPQLEANDLMMPFEMPGLGEVRAVGSPVRFSRHKLTTDHLPGEVGADTVAVLREHGLSDDTIDDLLADGVVHAHAAHVPSS